MRVHTGKISRGKDGFISLVGLIFLTTRFCTSIACNHTNHSFCFISIQYVERYICFYAFMFGLETHLTIKMDDVIKLSKEYTYKTLPDAIAVTTRNGDTVWHLLSSVGHCNCRFLYVPVSLLYMYMNMYASYLNTGRHIFGYMYMYMYMNTGRHIVVSVYVYLCLGRHILSICI